MNRRQDMVSQPQGNPCLTMPLARVRTDALHGVQAAREAWRVRDPQSAATALGRIVEPSAEAKVQRNMGDRSERLQRAAEALSRTWGDADFERSTGYG